MKNTSVLLSEPAQGFVTAQTELATSDAVGDKVLATVPFLPCSSCHVLQLNLSLCGRSRTKGLFKGEKLHFRMLLDPFSSHGHLSSLLSQASFTSACSEVRVSWLAVVKPARTMHHGKIRIDGSPLEGIWF